MNIRLNKYAWYIGCFYSTRYKTLFICPLPFIQIYIPFRKKYIYNSYGLAGLEHEQFDLH